MVSYPRAGVKRPQDRALEVRDQRLARASDHVHLVEDIIGARPISVPAQHLAARAVVLQHLAVVRISHVEGGDPVDRLALAPALRIVGVAHRVACPTRRSEPVLRIITIGECAVRGEVAVCIVHWCDRANCRVLVECVRRVRDGTCSTTKA